MSTISTRIRASSALAARVSARAIAYFDAEGIFYDRQRTGHREELSIVLDSSGLPRFEAVLEFESSFGGIISSPDETVLLLGTYQALLCQQQTERYRIDEQSTTLTAEQGWPRARWKGVPVVPVGHWHAAGDLYIDQQGIMYGYRWDEDVLRALSGSGRAFVEASRYGGRRTRSHWRARLASRRASMPTSHLASRVSCRSLSSRRQRIRSALAFAAEGSLSRGSQRRTPAGR